MFGKKQRRIESLEGRIADLDKLQPYVPLAQEIDRRISAFSAEIEQADDPGRFIDSLIPTMSEEARVEYLKKLFQQMPFNEQLEVLRKFYDDDEVIKKIFEEEREALLIKRKNKAAKLARMSLYEGLVKCAESDRFVDLGSIPEGQTIEIDMDQSNRLSDLETSRIVARTTTSPGKLHVLRHGGFEHFSNSLFLSDHMLAEIYKAEYVEPHHVITLGTNVIDGNESTVEPILYKDAELYIKDGERELNLRGFELSRFALNGEVVF